MGETVLIPPQLASQTVPSPGGCFTKMLFCTMVHIFPKGIYYNILTIGSYIKLRLEQFAESAVFP